ncbi:MAG: hypothetical protein A7316_03560 [Candidatus Altiarchaeales archaeon WOR_SM1_86-2]|nr:MAG: hypothetical protein A7316_03560 [Candidatus Altiarchaeales archaeon WOR_SM1_86-2]
MNIKIRGGFSAAHYIEGHQKCGQLHGHNFTVWLTVSVKDTGKQIELDFDDLKGILDGVLAGYDHENIGNKSSEELIREFQGVFRKQLEKFNQAEKFRVGVYETPDLGVEGDWVGVR